MCAYMNSFEQGLPELQQEKNQSLLQTTLVPPDGLTRKRTREDGEDLYEPAKRLATSTAEVLFRLLVPASKIGKVIGKQGLQIKQLREETGARIKIAEPLSTAEERVVLISSRDEPGQPDCAAHRALIRLAILVIEPETGDRVAATIGPQHHSGPNLTRLLIAGSQAGSVIGKGGITIKEIRETSGANVRILPREQLPMCASASDTDRLIQMSGEIPQIERALELIATKLRENPPREVVTTYPSYYLAANAQQQMLMSQAGFSGYTFPSSNPDPLSTQPSTTDAAAYGTVITDPEAIAGYTGPVPIIPKVTAEMKVPSSLIGGVIGRGGANITQIRQLSGATVKVTGQKDGTLERIIYFEGTSEQVTLAQNLVQSLMTPQQQVSMTPQQQVLLQ